MKLGEFPACHLIIRLFHPAHAPRPATLRSSAVAAH